MTWEEWTQIVGRFNASFPRQPLEPITAREFYDELGDRPAGRVWEAIRRLRRRQSFAPSLAELVEACAAVARHENTHQSHRALAARDPNSRGVPPPDNYKAARERFLSASRVPDNPPGRSRAKQLAELEAEMAKEESAP